MLVTWENLCQLNASWSAELDRLPSHIDRVDLVANELGCHTSLFENLACGGLVWKLTGFDVPARRQPSSELLMKVKEHVTVVDDKDGDCELSSDLRRCPCDLGHRPADPWPC